MAAPAVSMLWESVDPYATLVTRFGFAGPDDVVAWLRSTLAEYWGIVVRRGERLVLSAGSALAWLETDAGLLLAKWTVYPQLHGRLAELGRLVAWLHDRGLPVSPPLPALDGRVQVELPTSSIGLQEVRAGAWLDPADPDQVEDAGAVLARLHLAMADYPGASLIGVPVRSPDGGALPERTRRWLGQAGASRVPEVASRLRDQVNELSEDGLPPRQLVHRDIRSANLLCTGKRITTVLDFEETAPDHAVADLTKAAVMLGTKFRNWGPVPAETHRRFLDGYQRVRPLSPSEKAWVPVLMAGLTLWFAAKGDNPVGWGASARRLVSPGDVFA